MPKILKPTKILVINGPNLNLLGKREPEKYGTQTLADLEKLCNKKYANSAEIEFFQSNHEGQIIDKLQATKANHLVLNLGAYTHTSIAIADALSFAMQNNGVIKAVEVHISNVYKREEFRQISYISHIASGVIAGCGLNGYLYAIDFCLQD